MAVFRPFKAVRPKREYAARVAALPYDVMSSGEAREMVKDDPYSFLHIDRPEVDLDPSVNIYDPAVYKKAGENLKGLLTAGINVREEKPVYYIYRQIMDGRAQAGIVGCASIDDYENNIIKKHELTREDKEEDRVRHVDACNANTGPIFLTFRDDGRVTEFINSWMGNHDALFDFTADDGIRHAVWTIDDAEVIGSIERYFGAVPSFYIADGHHRCASAYRVGKMRRAAKPDYDGTEEFNFFLSVLFPANELKIGKHTVNCFVEGKWYALTAKKGSFDENDPVAQLDVSILQDNLLGPVLGIDDPRTDERIRFIGGIRGLGELERLVNEGGGAAFAMYPTTLDDLMTIADTGLIMPPKSTWFEPKLRSGLFIHELS